MVNILIIWRTKTDVEMYTKISSGRLTGSLGQNYDGIPSEIAVHWSSSGDAKLRERLYIWSGGRELIKVSPSLEPLSRVVADEFV